MYLYLSAGKHSYATKKTIYKTQTGMLNDYQAKMALTVTLTQLSSSTHQLTCKL